MITRVEIKNYRSIAHADVSLGPLTVLVGRNGSGKSSFVDALKFVRDALQIGLENAVNARGGFDSFRRWNAPEGENLEIAIELREGNVEGRYEVALSGRNLELYINREKALFRSQGLWPDDPPETSFVNEIEFERQGKDWVTKPPETFPVSSRFHGIVNLSSLQPAVLALPALMLFVEFSELQNSLDGHFHTLFPDALREPQKRKDAHGLNDKADNFLSVLELLLQDENVKAEVVNALNHVANGVSDVRVGRVSGYLVGELQHGELENSPWFDLLMESDGTVRMLGLLTALYQTPSFTKRGVLALEEPEIALHPGALAILADEIQAASNRRQLLITTQSPDLISRFPAKDLRVVERRDGVTHIAPLDETQRQIIEDQLFDAGELLRSEGLRGAGGN